MRKTGRISRSKEFRPFRDIKLLFFCSKPVRVQTVFIYEVLHVIPEGFTQFRESGVLRPDQIILRNLGRIGDQLCYDMRIGRIGRLGEDADTGILFSQRKRVQIIGGPAEKFRREAE